VLSDAQLARAAQSGDAANLGVLLERHRAPLYALALRFLGYGPMHKTPSRTPSSQLCAPSTGYASRRRWEDGCAASSATCA
jgi:hypothetical protein